jgi:hypothetical protein
MASITTRQTGTTGVQGVTRKNLPLTNAEIDTNFINLNNNKLENSNNLSDVASASTSRTNLGLGTIATQASNSVTITGGSITGITDLAVADGGTGLSSSGGSGFLLIGNSSNTFTAATLTGTTNRITVTNGSGSITISAPQDIATASNVQFGSLGIGASATGVSGNITATSITETSSERLKENIVPIPNALDSILKLNGVNFDWKDKTSGFGKQAGLIAEQVAPIIPEVVDFDSDGNTTGIQYGKLVAYLIESVKELKAEIDMLKGNK